MVKLGIISDSHRADAQLNRFLAVCKREKYDAIIHLGDVCRDARWLEDQLEVPLISVAGNCDPLSRHLREARLTYEGHSLLAVHGDAYSVKYGYERLSYYAEEVGAKIVLFGHTHRQFAGYVGKSILINPGALCDGQYAELHIDKRDVIPFERNLRDIK